LLTHAAEHHDLEKSDKRVDDAAIGDLEVLQEPRPEWRLGDEVANREQVQPIGGGDHEGGSDRCGVKYRQGYH